MDCDDAEFISSHPPRRGPSKHVTHDMRYYFRAASTPTATPNAAARATVVDECRARPTTDGGVEATGDGTYFEATAAEVGG